jgi:hypothetical protein
MNLDHFKILYPVAMTWIQHTLDEYANAVTSEGVSSVPHLPEYFSAELLASTKVVVVDSVPVLPVTSWGLSHLAEIENTTYEGVTYLDTIFVKRRSASLERVYFHELIHVLQWRFLGPERFLFNYANGLEEFGYRNSPLELMAYEAEFQFCETPGPFDAERLVKNKLDSLPLEAE